jgi:hypothetical protein
MKQEIESLKQMIKQIGSQVQAAQAVQAVSRIESQEHQPDKKLGKESASDIVAFNNLPSPEEKMYAEGGSFSKIISPLTQKNICCWYKGILPDERCASIHTKSVPIPHLHEYDLKKSF